MSGLLRLPATRLAGTEGLELNVCPYPARRSSSTSWVGCRIRGLGPLRATVSLLTRGSAVVDSPLIVHATARFTLRVHSDEGLWVLAGQGQLVGECDQRHLPAHVGDRTHHLHAVRTPDDGALRFCLGRLKRLMGGLVSASVTLGRHSCCSLRGYVTQGQHIPSRRMGRMV